MEKDDQNYPDMNRLCRLCLKSEESTSLIEIFSSNCNQKKQPSIPMRIMACASLEVQISDEYPKSICTDCQYQLEKSYYFRKRSQTADTRLRKHFRLISLGKPSYIFDDSSEDYIECETELVDSLQIIQDYEEHRDQRLIDTKLNSQIEKLKNECKQELRAELSNKIRDELRKEIRLELEGSLRNKLRAECYNKAKSDLREEVKEECRQIELQDLLGELDIFLKKKRLALTTDPSKNLLGRDIVVAPKKHTSKRKAYFEPVQKTSKTKLDKVAVEDTNASKIQEEYISLDTHLQTETTGNDNSYITNNPENDQTADNYLIFETNEREESSEEEYANQSSEHGAEEYVDYYTGEETETQKFNLTLFEESQHNNEITYQIDLNDMRFIKKDFSNSTSHDKTDDITLFNVEGGEESVGDEGYPEDNQYESLDIVAVEKTVIKSANKNLNKEHSTFPKISKISSTSGVTIERTFYEKSDTVKTFKCELCPIAFSTSKALNRHTRTHLKIEQNGVVHQCPRCQVYVSTRGALRRHMVIHTGQRPYKCEHCDKSFVQREILTRHMITHTGDRPFKCKHCDRSFSQKMNLTQHINKHHLEVPKLQLHKCHLCPKSFNHASGLSRHLSTHSGVSFLCSTCQRTFADRSSIKRHVLHVHGEGDVEKIRIPTSFITENNADVDKKIKAERGEGISVDIG